MKHRGGAGSGGNNGFGGASNTGNDDMVLPLTMSDLLSAAGTSTTAATTGTRRFGGGGASSSTVRIRRVRKKKQTGGASSSSNMWGLGTLLCFILTAGLLVALVQQQAFVQNYGTMSRKNSGGGDDALQKKTRRQQRLAKEVSFQDFPSLQHALQHSDVVLLYFAASWCPMSTPITELLDELFSPLLLLVPPPSLSSGDEAEQARDLEQHQPPEKTSSRQTTISLVYVSSDQSKEDMEHYKKEKWMVVPFESVNDERAQIKRHFQTCAQREMNELRMTTRQHEIPTIVVLPGSGSGSDSGALQEEQHQVLTFHGIKDIQHALAVSQAENEEDQETIHKEAAQSVIDSWMELKRLSNSLADKFEQ